ncbi:MAG: hypothetical protein NZ518_00845, partial [Dehalococcoidia bacterium]|nr:hypothetical protein [Dehalococcoidia bacterium]
MTTRALRPTTGPDTMTYWQDIIAQTARLDLPPTEHTNPTARGTMMNKIFVIRLRRGEPVEARELGDNGAPSVVFADPERVYADILADKLNPIWQVQNG